MIYVHVILIIVFSIYFGWMLALIFGWLIRNSKKTSTIKGNNKLSVLIPFRNEQENLPRLLKSLAGLDYTAKDVEFIFIDDHSTDKSSVSLEQGLKEFPFPYKSISLDEKYIGKKRAIEMGVSIASYPVIVTSDADCVHSKNWLQEINKLFIEGEEFVVAPVINKKEPGLLSNLQQIESLLLAGITVGSATLNVPMLCSGANLSYSKSVFKKLDPYKSNYKVLSGDDMFFLEKAKKGNTLIQVNSNSVVETEGAKSLAGMFARSIRWAGKSSQLNMSLSTIFGAIVLITNYSILFIVALVILGDDSIVFFIKLCATKTIADVLFLVLLANRYHRYQMIIYFPVMVVFYPFYLLAISIGAIFSSPSWKGR